MKKLTIIQKNIMARSGRLSDSSVGLKNLLDTKKNKIIGGKK